MPVLKKIASLVILALVLGLGFGHISNYLRWPPPAYSQPEVYNLTKENVVWEVHYGQPELCGKLECHLLEGYASANFEKRQVLPVREFPLAGYKTGDIIYYRTKIQIPSALLADDQIPVFHSLNIWAEKYHFYVNGRLVDIGTMDTISIPIPKGLIPDNREITLMFRVDPGKLHYQGLAHMSDILLGTKSGFASMQHAAHDLKNTYYLWHLLPRLAVCLVFVFFLLSIARDSEMFLLVMYSFSGAMYIYLVSDLPKVLFSDVSIKASISPVFNILSTVLFFAVTHRFFRRPTDKLSRVGLIGGILLVLATAIYAAIVPAGVLHSTTNQVNNVLRIVGFSYAIYLAGVTWRFLAKSDKSPVRQRISAVFFVVNCFMLLVYLSVLLRVIPASHWSMTLFVSDTLLLIMFTALVSQEFGVTIVQRDQMKNTFKRFMGATVVDRLVHGAAVIKPNERLASVMFSDIRNFTPMCETMSPAAVFDFLNEYLEMMVAVITRHGGLIDKFGGDSIMVVWGAPDEDGGHAQKAAACALEMRAALVAFNQQRTGEGLQPIRIGIGIHSGAVISGAVGSQERQEFTVLGDAVNTAARVEGLTKQHDTDIIVSGATWKLLGAAATGRSLGTAQVKGKSRELEIFALEALRSEVVREAA